MRWRKFKVAARLCRLFLPPEPEEESLSALIWKYENELKCWEKWKIWYQLSRSNYTNNKVDVDIRYNMIKTKFFFWSVYLLFWILVINYFSSRPLDLIAFVLNFFAVVHLQKLQVSIEIPLNGPQVALKYE